LGPGHLFIDLGHGEAAFLADELAFLADDLRVDQDVELFGIFADRQIDPIPGALWTVSIMSLMRRRTSESNSATGSDF
jgi:hypothetical protein